MSGAPPSSPEGAGTLSAARPVGATPIDFEQLIARSPNPYVVLDRDLTIVWMNEAYLGATMRRREEITGKRMFEAFPSDPDSESFRLLERSFQRVLKTGQPDELALIRYDIRKSDGSMDERYWSATHQPLLDEAGKTAYILQHTVDVTELHNLRALRDEMGVIQRAEAVQARNRDLAQESQQLRALFEQAPGFIAVLSGSDHRFVLANQAYSSLSSEGARSSARPLPRLCRKSSSRASWNCSTGSAPAGRLMSAAARACACRKSPAVR